MKWLFCKLLNKHKMPNIVIGKKDGNIGYCNRCDTPVISHNGNVGPWIKNNSEEDL